MKSKFLLLAIGICLFTFSITHAAIYPHTATYLDFGIDAIHSSKASIWYAGGSAPLSGCDISVDDVTGFSTPMNSGVKTTIQNGLLSFKTGNLISSGPGTWTFGGGGSITLDGNIGTGNITLFSGSFNTAVVQAMQVMPGKLYFGVVLGGFEDTKHKDLLKLYGLPEVLYLGNLNISFYGSGSVPGVGGPFQSLYVLSGNIVNTPVPVPASVVLLGSGLLGLVGISRFRRKK